MQNLYYFLGFEGHPEERVAFSGLTWAYSSLELGWSPQETMVNNVAIANLLLIYTSKQFNNITAGAEREAL